MFRDHSRVAETRSVSVVSEKNLRVSRYNFFLLLQVSQVAKLGDIEGTDMSPSFARLLESMVIREDLSCRYRLCQVA